MALPVPEILMHCNYLQNVVAITYIFVLQLSTFLFYNKQWLNRLEKLYVRYRRIGKESFMPQTEKWRCMSF